jgi:hypothetical protein
MTTTSVDHAERAGQRASQPLERQGFSVCIELCDDA